MGTIVEEIAESAGQYWFGHGQRDVIAAQTAALKRVRSRAFAALDEMAGGAIVVEASQDLAREVNGLAVLEGRADAYRHVLTLALTRDLSLEDFLAALLDRASRKADDEWSGRGNDVRRSYADGQREMYQHTARVASAAIHDRLQQGV
jgi:hypothetical protein